ncbi:MAG: GNAT family N-acetyltransferase [Spirochaetaceae bacterium]|jgi:ribosomal protein S18 acetylase RimI-like enzyme|nr:GNAT family N-acetyltransferase [Spirochaetaceae bacterium]
MAAFIRQAHGADVPYLYEICLKTGDNGKDASDSFHDPFLLGQYYAAPYFFHDPGLCFVVEDRFPQGYIVATEDTIAFRNWLALEWLPPLQRRYQNPYPPEKIRTDFERLIRNHLYSPLIVDPCPPWFRSYPAHLHIDLLPAYQRQGLGAKLLAALFEELERRGCPGVHLIAGMDNPNAIAFYQKQGLETIQEAPWALTMGKTFGKRGA